MMEGVIFDNAATQLLEVPCREILQKDNTIQLLKMVRKKEAKFQVQVEKDIKTGVTRCIVNNAILLNAEASGSTTPTTPKNPPTPPQVANTTKNKETTIKRQLFQDEGNKTITHTYK